ncbi:discoidin domain-containing protein [Sporosarcina sp. NPDC096371]|uniref:discoidin domain-containing protein n=1 Tax=Sporosarcina sp. NPDC096371 TaxID=3364530 RepID=UPI0038191D60
MKSFRRIFCMMALLAVLQLPMQSLLFASTVQAEQMAGRDYYISSQNGNNNSDGKTAAKSWETLEKLKEVELQPGDRVLLESGSVFNDFIHLRNVHGTAENPIIITSYGEGNKPVINGNGQGVWYQDYVQGLDNAGHKKEGYVSSTILLYDSSFIEISQLEITNQSDDWDYMQSKSEQLKQRMSRTGVAGIAQNSGTMEHIYLDNLYIHDIDGNLEDKHMNNGGIQFNVSKPENEAETGIARYHDIRITNNRIQNVHRSGIAVGYTYQHNQFIKAEISDETASKYGHTEILIDGNYIQEAGNDAIVIMYADRPVIRNNVSDKSGADLDDGYPGYWMSFSAGIWSWKTKNALFEYNEVFDTVGEGNGDGQAWDIDYSDGTIYQYNYSHNNGGGALLVCLTDSVNGTFRYNISQNDLKAFLTFQGNPLAKVYNNVFYVDGDRSTRVHHPEPQKRGGVAYVANNIFYNASSNNPNDEWNPGNNKTFTNNLYYGYESIPANDQFAIVADPLFENAGKAPDSTTGVAHPIEQFAAYKLTKDSPAINKGAYIRNNATTDFFKQPIGLLPDIGVHEFDGVEEDVQTINSDVYTVLADKIVNIPTGTTVDSLIANIKKTASTVLEVKRNDKVLNAGDVIGNGDVVAVTFGNGVKSNYVLETAKVYHEYDPKGMIASAGSHQAGEEAAKAIDDDNRSMWHTAWAGAKQEDVWISVDLQEVKPISMLKYVPRQTGGVNGIFTKFSIYVKDNAEDEWEKVALLGENSWQSNNETKYAYFDEISARYIKLHAEESTSVESGKLFGSAAEIRVGYEIQPGGEE